MYVLSRLGGKGDSSGVSPSLLQFDNGATDRAVTIRNVHLRENGSEGIPCSPMKLDILPIPFKETFLCLISCFMGTNQFEGMGQRVADQVIFDRGGGGGGLV